MVGAAKIIFRTKFNCKWLLEHQHKLNKVVRCCHMRAVKEAPVLETEDYSQQLITIPKRPPVKPTVYASQNLATRLFNDDNEYKMDEARMVPQRSFKYTDLEIQLAQPNQLYKKPDVSELQFGKYFTDHMLKIYYNKALGGWQTPHIVPFENISLHPAAKVLHYAVELFEGMKAYRGTDGQVRMFRPLLNMERMNASAVRAGLPTFDGQELVRLLARLISIDQEWVPHTESASLYIRPTLIGIDGTLGVASSDSALLYTIICPVGSYFVKGTGAVSLLADPRYTRAWRGGCGDRKMGSNYGPTIRAQSEATRRGRQQPIWLFGDDHQLTEVGTMNLFMFYINEHGERELVTPALNGLILPGITRHSILQLARQWGEFKVTERSINMAEVISLLNQNRLLEIFGAGTACIVSPVDLIEYLDHTLYIPTMEHRTPVFRRFLETLTAIQYGHVEHPWAELVN